MRRLILLGVVAGAFCYPGCTSFKSTMFHRGEDNCDWYKGPVLKGVPTTFRTVTHARIDIVESRFLTGKTAVDASKNIGIDGAAPTLHWLDGGKPARTVKITLIETEKIITVDPKRPLSGAVEGMKMGFTGQQLNQLDYKVNDTTIQDITTVVKSFFPKGIIQVPGTQSTSVSDAGMTTEGIDKALLKVDSVVASTILEIEDPDFEANLRYFLNHNLNDCHGCSDVLTKR